MKQENFIQTLRHELSYLPKHEVDEILADYREYISDAIAAGRNEEEVIAALGDPAKLARELKAQANYRQWESNRSLSNLMRVVISIAGLGVMNFLLFFPFLIYMILLSAGYMVSIALMICGVVMVIGAGGSKLFNWPLISLTPGSHTFLWNAGDDAIKGHDSHNSSRIHEVRVDNDHFVIKLDDGEEANLVMASGAPVTLESDDGKISVDSDDDNVKQMIVKQPDGGVSIARKDVRSINVENDEGESFNFATDAKTGQTHWAGHSGDDDVAIDQDAKTGSGHLVVHSKDGDVAIEQNAKTGSGHLVVNNGNKSVVIDGNHVVIDDGGDHFSVAGVSGMSLIGTSVLFGIGFMIVGALGLWLCIWLSRLTWHVLGRYLKYQISVVTGKEPLNTAV